MAKGGQTPKDPTSGRMQAAWKLKEAGDVLAARRAAQRLLTETPSAEDAAQARELLERSLTPRALYGFAALAAVCLVLLVLLASTRY
jgi:hypothetical protein